MTVLIFYDRGGGLVQSTLDWYEPADEAALLKVADPRRSYGKLRRALRELRDTEAAWNAAVTPAQQGIGWGDYWLRRWEGSPDAPPVTIYGHVMPLFDVIEREQAACRNLGVPAAEAEGEIDRAVAKIKRGYARGWRYGMAWSRAEPGGELGSAHIATLEPLTRAGFLAARRDGWP